MSTKLTVIIDNTGTESISGDRACAIMREELGSKFEQLRVGLEMTF